MVSAIVAVVGYSKASIRGGTVLEVVLYHVGRNVSKWNRDVPDFLAGLPHSPFNVSGKVNEFPSV